jgi:uncharacterized membrane protein
VILCNAQWLLKHTRTDFVCMTVMLVSLIAYAPALFITSIEPVYKSSTASNQTILSYNLTQSQFGKTMLAKTYLTVMSSVRICLVTIVLLVLNTVTIVLFRSYLKKKLNLNNSSRFYSLFKKKH